MTRRDPAIIVTRCAIAVGCALWFSPPTEAFNAHAHKVIADIAWQQLDDTTRAKIIATLRRHPRFGIDFIDAENDREVFQLAAVWPDTIRGNPDFDMPTWHYVNFPLFVGGELPVSFNRATAPEGDRRRWNISQAIAHCRAVLASDAAPGEKAVAYCWLFHLIGDLHQPLHSTALVCERFPNGDRGGNEIPVMQRRNLHALWDGLLGTRGRPEREAEQLKSWKTDTAGDVPAWIAESHELAKAAAYSAEILSAVQAPGELRPINLPREYLQAAGAIARARVAAAGARLGALLQSDAAKPKR
jgi:hypothetical protein